MGVLNTRELPRTFEREIGKAGVAIRRWVVTLSDDTLSNNPTVANDIFAATTGLNFGTPHADSSLSSWKFRKGTMQEGYEGNPYLVLMTGEYSILRDTETVSPLSRDAVWSFEGQGIEVPALYYYDGFGNGTMRPLTNSAYDYFPGLTTTEYSVRARVQKNYASLPSAQLQATNALNSDAYLGGVPHTWKCAGVNTQYTQEEWNGAVVKYWATTSEIIFRASTWNLQLPDIGWNFLAGGQKRRAMVFDFQNGEWVASANPVGLDGSGNLTLGAPAILVRRVSPETSFQTLFGTPPT